MASSAVPIAEKLKDAKNAVPDGEVEKWLSRLEKRLAGTTASTDRGQKLLRNINAYRDDCKHWLAEKNVFLAFEAVVWAWALLETGEELGALKKR